MYVLLEFEKEIKDEVSRVLDIDIQLEIPDEERGDYALPCFAFSKKLKMSPKDIAAKIVSDLELSHGTMEQTGPYVNFSIHKEYLAENTLRTCLEMGEKFGELSKKNQKITVEHTSANPNGPLHVGRARNPIIGDTISRIYTKAGYDVETQFYVDDIGRQVAILSWGISNIPESELPTSDRKKIDHELVRYYQEANRRMEADEGVADGIKKLMKSIEEGDENTLRIFSENSDKVMLGMKESLERLNILHDSYKTESSLIVDCSVDSALSKLEGLEQCEREDNALYFEGGEHKIFLTRGDGTSLYPLRDIAYHIWKAGRADQLIDVLGEDHKVHGMFMKNILEALGIRPIPDIIFHSFVSFEGKRMSTRKGAYVTLDEIMDLAHERARDEVLKRRDDLSQDEVEKIAEMVGLGAVRYNIIRVQPEKPMNFKWDEALNFQGNSAPFIQYAHARAFSIIDKWGGDETKLISEADLDRLDEEGEIRLIKKLAVYPIVIDSAAGLKAPHIIANYAYDVSAQFNQFYRDYPVLKAEEKMIERLALVKASKNILSDVLNILGITAPEYM